MHIWIGVTIIIINISKQYFSVELATLVVLENKLQRSKKNTTFLVQTPYQISQNVRGRGVGLLLGIFVDLPK